MSTPTTVVPSKSKAWTSLIGSLLGAVVPFIAQVAGFLPAPYGSILTGILAVIGLFTGAAVHQATYAPKGTVLVPQSATKGPWK